MDNGEPDQAARDLGGKQVSKIRSNVAMTATGVVLPRNLAEVSELAQYMCKAGSSIPRLMRDNPGECMGVIMDAMGWGMNPFAVARQRYIVEDKEGNQVGAYMSQLITAVIQKFAPIQEKVIAPIYSGEGDTLKCKISVHHRDTSELMEYESPEIGPAIQAVGSDGAKVKTPGPGYKGIWPKNSPLWVSNPRVQLWYHTIRFWGRIHTPGILLGVYDIEEAHQAILELRDITPPKEKQNLLEDPKDAPVHIHTGEVMDTKILSPEKVRIDRATQETEQRRREAETIEPQVPLDETNTYTFESQSVGSEASERVTVDPETGEITDEDANRSLARAQSGRPEGMTAIDPEPRLGLDVPADVTPERMFKNLAKSLEAIATVKDYEAWRSDNFNQDTRKAIGDAHWKNLGALMTKTEDRIGYL